MRRTIPFVVTAVAAVVAVLGVMVGVGIGQTIDSHGGTPSDVYMLEEKPPQDCAPIGVTRDGVSIMPLQVELEGPSHILAYFSFDLSGLDSWEQAQVTPSWTECRWARNAPTGASRATAGGGPRVQR